MFPKRTRDSQRREKSLDASDLRGHAEERLKIQSSEAGGQRSTEDTERLLHELQVHQIELEIQNEELQQARGEVERALASYTDLYDFAPVGYFTLNRDGTVRQANLTGTRMLGLERSGLVNRRFDLFVSGDSRRAFNAFLEEVFASQAKRTCEVLLRQGGHPPFWAYIEAGAAEDGQACHAVVVDITEREQAAHDLLASETRYRRLFECAKDGILILDARTGRIVDANPFLVELLGHTHAEFLGKRLWEIGLFKDIAANEDAFAKLRKCGCVRYENLPLQTKDGRPVAVEFVSSVYPVNSRAVIQCSIRDITERKHAEEQLKESARKLRKMMDGTIKAMSSALEAGDPYTMGHEKRVSQLACAIAAEMGLPQDRIEGIRIAGYMHDIGKIAVPAEILSKPGKISDLEFGIIKTHPQYGYDILKEIDFGWPIALVTLQHHERPDGSGYPQGLQGNEILLEARILAVADTVEAMSSHRPYRPAPGTEKALEEMTEGKGRLYDLRVVEACVKLFKEDRLKFE